jgi:hypothetical protein
VFGVPWIARVHALLSTLSRGGAAATAELDEIYRERVACERALRISLALRRRYQAHMFLSDTHQQPHWRAGQDF